MLCVQVHKQTSETSHQYKQLYSTDSLRPVQTSVSRYLQTSTESLHRYSNLQPATSTNICLLAAVKHRDKSTNVHSTNMCKVQMCTAHTCKVTHVQQTCAKYKRAKLHMYSKHVQSTNMYTAQTCAKLHRWKAITCICNESSSVSSMYPHSCILIHSNKFLSQVLKMQTNNFHTVTAGFSPADSPSKSASNRLLSSPVSISNLSSSSFRFLFLFALFRLRLLLLSAKPF